jgi:hypothetical protein
MRSGKIKSADIRLFCFPYPYLAGRLPIIIF